MSPIIEIKNLTKQYGKRTAVNRLNLSVESGEIFGFVGPNGAGKTTTMRILATLLQASSGEAYVAGHSVKKAARGVRGARPPPPRALPSTPTRKPCSARVSLLTRCGRRNSI